MFQVSGKSPSWKDPDCARPDLPDYCQCRKQSTMRELMTTASSLKDHSKLVDQMAGMNKGRSLPEATTAINPWAECLFRFGRDCTKGMRKDRPMMEQIFNALEKVHQNPSYLIWMATLPLGDETEYSLSSVEEYHEGKFKKYIQKLVVHLKHLYLTN